MILDVILQLLSPEETLIAQMTMELRTLLTLVAQVSPEVALAVVHLVALWAGEPDRVWLLPGHGRVPGERVLETLQVPAVCRLCNRQTVQPGVEGKEVVNGYYENS